MQSNQGSRNSSGFGNKPIGGWNGGYGSESVADVIKAQAEDDGLWFESESIVEAYLQQELRRLHAAVERETANV